MKLTESEFLHIGRLSDAFAEGLRLKTSCMREKHASSVPWSDLLARTSLPIQKLMNVRLSATCACLARHWLCYNVKGCLVHFRNAWGKPCVLRFEELYTCRAWTRRRQGSQLAIEQQQPIQKTGKSGTLQCCSQSWQHTSGASHANIQNLEKWHP